MIPPTCVILLLSVMPTLIFLRILTLGILLSYWQLWVGCRGKGAGGGGGGGRGGSCTRSGVEDNSTFSRRH